MTLTSLMRRNNPPKDFERYTLPAALWQLKASCSFHGRKMLRICLMLLRDEREALWAVRVLDAWAGRLPYYRSVIVYRSKRADLGWQCTAAEGSDEDGYDHRAVERGATADAARIAAAKALVAEDPTLNPPELT
jgi:hypothetical protein